MFYETFICFYVSEAKPLFPGDSQEMPGTEVPLGWVAIFELRYRDGSRFLPSGIKIGIDFQTLV